MTNPRLTPADLRRRTFKLLLECWLPMLITLLLSGLPTLIGNLFLHLSPVDAAQLESRLVTPTGGQTDWMTLIMAIGIEYLGSLLISPILMLGLQKGLLAHSRGERCMLSCIGGGFTRWKTAIALEFQTGLRILGYLLLGSIVSILLSFVPLLGALASSIGMLVLSWWVTMRYALARCHLADDHDGTCSASSSLDYSVADVYHFTIGSLIEVIWPALLPMFISRLVAKLMPHALGLSMFTAGLDLLASAISITGFTVVYLYLRGTFAVEGEAAIDPGLARALALAAGLDANEDTAPVA